MTEPYALTSAELDALQLSVDLWNKFLTLPVQHQDDVQEFRHCLHDLQRMIMARPTFRLIKGGGAL